jgi:hypothetical protein
VDRRAGLDDVEKILDPTETRTPTPASSNQYPVAIPITLSRLLTSLMPSLFLLLLKILPFALYLFTCPLSVQALHSRSCLSYVSYATTAA